VVFILTLVVMPANGAALRSTLYPAGWTPEFTDGAGRFLHDFSYSGYQKGEMALPVSFALPVFDAVTGYGADNTGTTDATSAIQAALNAAGSAGGGVVHLAAGLYRCDGALTVGASNTVLRGEGPENTRVYFTASSGISYNAHITFAGTVAREADIPLAQDGENRSFVVKVGDASALNVGDEVAVDWTITDAFVAEHGMTGTWLTFNGLWKPFFRREIVAIDRNVTPQEVTLDVPLRYPAKLRDGASLRRESGYLSECVVQDLALSNAVDTDTAWQQNQVHVLSMLGVKNSFIRNVQSFASPNPASNGAHLQSCGIEVSDAKRVTVSDCRMEKAQNRGSGGNGYLIEVRSSSEILFNDCVGLDGRHNFIQNWDFGAMGIVWLRCHSAGGTSVTRLNSTEIGFRADSEYHHSLATACLVDSCLIEDGWGGGNRGSESSGAGHSVTQSVCWNGSGNGTGRIRSFNYGNGYVIGTRGLDVYTLDDVAFGSLDVGTAPPDFTEALNAGDQLEPQSLYEDQLRRRLGLEPPIVDFTVDQTLGPAPLRVQFTDTSYPGAHPIQSRIWEFGDGEEDDTANPVHVYAKAGQYAVSLSIVTEAGTFTAEKAAYINVRSRMPVASLGGLALLTGLLALLSASRSISAGRASSRAGIAINHRGVARTAGPRGRNPE
jgi:PKD repeat protein